jgi:trans-aconitate methyltransferase
VAESHWDPALYDDRHSFVWKQTAGLVELLRLRPGERVLDLGCGTGHLTAQLAAAGADVVGLDSASEMVARARQAYPNLRFELADARTFAVSGPFDAVFSNAALHWVREPAAVIARVAAALRPGGRFVAEFGGRGNVRTVIASLEAAARQLGVGPLAHPWYYPGIAEYAGLLERGGLEVTHAELFDRPTPLESADGLRNWVRMFVATMLEQVPPSRREDFLRLVEMEARPALFRDGQWFADYRRLRVVAGRVEGGG